MTEVNQDIINKLTGNNKIILQIFREDGSHTVEYLKSINDIKTKLNIPYSTLINVYYICTNKGGGKAKSAPKKYIHSKYLELLKHIRIFDTYNEELMYNKPHFDKLLAK
jgi:hypothetical protein